MIERGLQWIVDGYTHTRALFCAMLVVLALIWGAAILAPLPPWHGHRQGDDVTTHRHYGGDKPHSHTPMPVYPE